jgi:hypothetical protein
MPPPGSDPIPPEITFAYDGRTYRVATQALINAGGTCWLPVAGQVVRVTLDAQYRVESVTAIPAAAADNF